MLGKISPAGASNTPPGLTNNCIRGAIMAKKSIEEMLRGVTRFGRLTFICEGEPYISKHKPVRRARVRCDCGIVKDIRVGNLVGGTAISCGCYSIELSTNRLTKHDAYYTPEYSSWSSMVRRCTSPRATSWPRYGGRGIRVCDRWLESFENFYADMGVRPEGTSIDRINPNGNYEPSNCRWATNKQQRNNRRDTIYLTANGATMTMGEWEQKLGCHRGTIRDRLNRGWSEHDAITKPMMK